MKKAILLALLAVMVFSLFGCKETAATEVVEEQTEDEAVVEETAEEEAVVEEQAEQETYKVGISMFVMDAGMTALTAGLEAVLTNADIPIEVSVTSADGSMEKQVSDVEDLVTKGMDLIYITGFDQDAIVGAVEYAYENDVIVGLGGEVSTDKYDYRFSPFSVDQTGLLQAAWLVENYLNANPDTEYKIAMSNGTLSTAGGAGRHDGFIRGLEESGATNYEIVVDQDNNYVTETAQAWAEGLMTSHPEVNVIQCANDDMALGVANAIDAVGRTGEIIVLGTDGMETGLVLMREGKMEMTVKLNVAAIAQGMAQAMIDALKGVLVLDENRVAMGDPSLIFTIVDSTNLQEQLEAAGLAD